MTYPIFSYPPTDIFLAKGLKRAIICCTVSRFRLKLDQYFQETFQRNSLVYVFHFFLPSILNECQAECLGFRSLDKKFCEKFLNVKNNRTHFSETNIAQHKTSKIYRRQSFILRFRKHEQIKRHNTFKRGCKLYFVLKNDLSYLFISSYRHIFS